MSTMNPLDPYGGTTPPIEQLLGNAYSVVRFVATNMDKIQEVNDNMEEIKEAGTIKADILDLRDEAEAAKDASVTASEHASHSAGNSQSYSNAANTSALSAAAHESSAQAFSQSAAASSANSSTYATEAKNARDGAIVGASLYPTEAEGRAAVENGATFNVQGNGDVASYQYRRVDASTSTLLAVFPSSSAVQKNADALSSVNYGAGYSDALPVPAGTSNASGLILMDWAQKAGRITKAYLGASAAGTVNVYVYSKSGDTFTLVRQAALTVPAAGYHVLPLNLAIGSGEYIAVSGAGGSLTYSVARADGNGIRSGTEGPLFTQATISTTTRLMIRFDVTEFTGVDRATAGITDSINQLVRQTLTKSSVQTINNLPPYQTAQFGLSTTATFILPVPAAEDGSLVFECNAFASGNVKLVLLTKISDTRYEQRATENVSVTVGLNSIPLIMKAKKGDYFAIKGSPVGYRTETSKGTAAFFTQNFAESVAWVYNTNILAGFKLTSFVAPNSSGIYSRPASVDLPWEYMFLPAIGHSLIEGSQTPTSGTSPITIEQEYDSLAFPSYPGNPSSLLPATVANSQIVTYTNRGEWSGLGAAAELRKAIQSQNGLKYTDIKSTVVVANNGVGGAKIADIAKGSPQYNSVIAQATALAGVSGGTSGVLAVLLGIGENDSNIAAYLPALYQLVKNFDTDLRAATGQVKRVPTVMYQQSTMQRGISIRQLTAARTSPFIALACPGYQLGYYDNIHIDSVSERILGAYFAESVKAVSLDNGKWEPLWPVDCEVSGNTVTMTFNKSGLVIDTSLVPAQINMGFAVSGTTVNTVTVINDKQVRIECSSTPNSGAMVSYGNAASGKGPYVGRAGNLRDSRGDEVVFDNFPLHNWCVEFDWTI